MSEREIEALRERIRREKLLVDAERPVFDRSVPPPLADELTEKPSLDMKQLLRLRSPMDIARPKLKPSFGDMAGEVWPPKIDRRKPLVIPGWPPKRDPRKPLVIPRGPAVAVQRKERVKRSVRR